MYKLNLVTEQQLLLENIINQLQIDNQLLMDQLSDALGASKLKSVLLLASSCLLFYFYFSTGPDSGFGFSLKDVSEMLLASSAKITSISSTEHTEVLRRATLTFDVCEKVWDILQNQDIAVRFPFQAAPELVDTPESIAVETEILTAFDLDDGDIVWG